VIVGIVVLSVVVLIVAGGLRAGDRIRGRALRLDRASRIARTQAEYLKARALGGQPPPSVDSSYRVSVGEMSFTVERRIVDQEPMTEQSSHCREIVLSVRPAAQDTPLVHFRLLQGIIE
jgi:hypothetical protein